MTKPTIPIHTRFQMGGDRYIITGFKVIGCWMRARQYECQCTSGPLRRTWMPEAEVARALREEPMREDAARPAAEVAHA